MNRPRPRHRAARGFTLLELLLSTAIGAIVLLVVNATFFAAIRLHNATHDRVDSDLMLQRTVAIVRKDLAGIVLPGNPTATTNTFSGQLATETLTLNSLDGTSERITPDIYTTSGAVDGWSSFGDVQMVSYYLSPAADGGPNRDLVRLVTRNLLPAVEPTAESQVLLSGVQSAAIQYYDGENWVDYWDSATSRTLPTVFRFIIALAPALDGSTSADPAPIELIVPVMVTAAPVAQGTTTGTTTTP